MFNGVPRIDDLHYMANLWQHRHFIHKFNLLLFLSIEGFESSVPCWPIFNLRERAFPYMFKLLYALKDMSLFMYIWDGNHIFSSQSLGYICPDRRTIFGPRFSLRIFGHHR